MSDSPHLPDDGGDDPAASDDAVIGRALRGSLLAAAALGLVIGATAYLLRRPPEPPPDEPQPVAPPRTRTIDRVDLPRIPLVDVTSGNGIDFVHENGAEGEKLLPETMGGGCAFFDYDDDGDQDLLLVNSCSWRQQGAVGASPAATAGAAPERPPSTLALYRNDGTGSFENVTAASGLDVTLYGMGAAVGDYDNDGDVDLFVSAVGANRLFENRDGIFHDVTADAGVGGDADRWSASCGWFDYDNDGDLDLLVANYVEWSPEIDLAQGFQLVGVGRAYGPPTGFGGTYPYLYRNDGDGKFSDVSASAGLQVRNEATGVPVGKSLGLLPVDLDRDGWLDVIVANDTVRNFVFHNRGDGTFDEIGAASGIAYDSSGKARGAMGIDAARFRNDDALGVAIGNFANEMCALYVSQGDQLLFTDDAVSTGLGPQTRLVLTFGMLFIDADLDGRPDLLAANGHLEEEINKVQQSQHYRQRGQLFWNRGPQGRSEFVPLTEAEVGSDLLRPIVGRGATAADIDGDGDLDLLLTQIAGPPLLLRNDQELPHHWLRFDLRGTTCNRDAIGAVVEVTVGDVTMRRTVMPTRSYLSQVELPVTFGLGSSERVDRVVVHWPGGETQEVEEWEVDGMTGVEQE